MENVTVRSGDAPEPAKHSDLETFEQPNESAQRYHPAILPGQHPQPPFNRSDHVKQTKQRQGWLVPRVVGLMIAIVIGAALGGGLGAALAGCKSDLRYASLLGNNGGARTVTRTITAFASTLAPSSTVTYSTTFSGLLLDYRAEPTGRIWSLYNPCPSNTRIDSFTIYCDIHVLTNIPSVQNSNLVVGDIAGVVAYSFSDCLQDCSNFNKWGAVWGRTERCRSVTFNPNITESVKDVGGNCWLKNGTVTTAGMVPSRGEISAMLS